jgi:hypothetical protein
MAEREYTGYPFGKETFIIKIMLFSSVMQQDR